MSDVPRVTVPAQLVEALRARVAELEAEVERQSETLKEHTRPPRPPNFLEAEIAELRSKLNQALAQGWDEGRLATLDELRWPGDVTLNSKANPYANVRPAAPVSEPFPVSDEAEAWEAWLATEPGLYATHQAAFRAGFRAARQEEDDV